MAFDHHPIPCEALLPGWGPVECCDGRFAYRHTRLQIELVADRVAATGFHPGLGLCQCWELTYRYSLDNRWISELIGRVSTRRAAADGILECMSRIHDTVDERSDPTEVEAALRRVSLDYGLPAGRQPTSR